MKELGAPSRLQVEVGRTDVTHNRHGPTRKRCLGNHASVN